MAVRIPLHGIHGEGKFAIVSDEDAHLAEFRWLVTSNGYVYRNVGHMAERRASALHHEVPGHHGSYDQPVDHRNRNKLDNRRENLQVCTPSVNLVNRPVRPDSKTGLKYVHIRERPRCQTKYVVHRNGKWYATFNTIDEAAKFASTLEDN